ncbi:ABC transporter substrate-binding protein [Saccharopolyspora hattusasensis]|uniref:ABC transporter substrate-binding protein n=1 Tax=Saccharopolyspora hattusasensis TaxID=1128679 RepID=UPI003D963D99
MPFTMRVDRPPFDDVRVRQAFRLVVDREQMIKQVLGGHGTASNDIYSPADPVYNSGCAATCSPDSSTVDRSWSR